MQATPTDSSRSQTLSQRLPQKRVPHTVLGWLVTCSIVAAWPVTGVTVPMRVASCAYFAMLAGLLLRKHKTWHLRLMNLAIASDLALVLVLQYKRSAIQTALGFTLNGWQQAHVGFSTLATLLYIPVLIIGWRLARSQRARGESQEPSSLRRMHRGLAIPAFVFRTLGFLLMFSMLGSSTH